MKFALLHNGTEHQVAAMKAMRKGLRAHGHDIFYGKIGANVAADIYVVWSIKNLSQIPGPYIVLEAGYINANTGNYLKDRNRFISFSIDGIHGTAKDHPPAPSSDRWEQLGIELSPWKERGEGNTLLVAQHPMDAVTGEPYQRWLTLTKNLLSLDGVDYVLREHPLINPDQRSLQEDLAAASRVLTYCSTTAVESVIAGIPTLAHADSSIATAVCSRSLEENLWQGDRLPWCHQLAYRQWQLDEIADGRAWEWMGTVLDS